MVGRFFIALIFATHTCVVVFSQHNATSREYYKAFKTYPYSDPDPIPRMDYIKKIGSIYPYFRYDGSSDTGVEKDWKVVELENEYLKIMILPEIGGKIWTVIEKSSGKSIVYFNSVVKFRDVAIRGPWTSGGFEFNYGAYGHSPGSAFPVDYATINKDDGSVSCVIQVLDILTRTTWKVDINLPADKAYFTTKSSWYNSSTVEQPYYSWTNVGVKVRDDLRFLFSGTRRIEHNGEVNDWPIDQTVRKDLSFYRNNDFGGYKSFHIFGNRSSFFGSYSDSEGVGIGRYSHREDKIGQKIWIWGLSQQGMLWEKLLTDSDGQYVEIQSGRLFNQTWEESSLTPFKRKRFAPQSSEEWTEYWFPIAQTGGAVAANRYGILNFKEEDRRLKIQFSPLQSISDSISITVGGKKIYSRHLQLRPLELFTDSIPYTSDGNAVCFSLGRNKILYCTSDSSKTLSRPVKHPADFNWDSVYGKYLKGREYIRQRNLADAEASLRACLGMDPNFLPALSELSMLLFRKMQYEEALKFAKSGLSIDTYDPATNYYYGLINMKLGKWEDAKDGFEVSSIGEEYRHASDCMLAEIYLRENNYENSIRYARKSTSSNTLSLAPHHIVALSHRLSGQEDAAVVLLDSLIKANPLNHFARFEKYILDGSERNKALFLTLIQNELPIETFLELAIWYYDLNRPEEAIKVLSLSPKNAIVSCWIAYLKGDKVNTDSLDPAFVFPHRIETAHMLEELIHQDDHWVLKYFLALINWNLQNIDAAGSLFHQCKNSPNSAYFYSTRAQFNLKHEIDSSLILPDLLKAISIDGNEWRFGKKLTEYYLIKQHFQKALSTSGKYYSRFPENYYLGLIYVRSLVKNNLFEDAIKALNKIVVLPNEGAVEGRALYKEANLMLALKQMEKKDYTGALRYIEASRLWPENLGVGKPYDADIDDRLENWLSYKCYDMMGDKRNAREMLSKILSFLPQATAYTNNYLSANILISAWAKDTFKRRDGELFLKEILDIQSNYSELTNWVFDKYFDKNEFNLQNTSSQDENFRILNSYLQIDIHE